MNEFEMFLGAKNLSRYYDEVSSLCRVCGKKWREGTAYGMLLGQASYCLCATNSPKYTSFVPEDSMQHISDFLVYGTTSSTSVMTYGDLTHYTSHEIQTHEINKNLLPDSVQENMMRPGKSSQVEPL